MRIDDSVEHSVSESGRAPQLTRPLSSGFFAGIVLVSDVASILLTGIVARIWFGDDFSLDHSKALAGIIAFGILVILTLKSAGLYRFTAIVEPKREVIRIAAIFVIAFLLVRAAALSLGLPADFSPALSTVWLLAVISVLVFFRIMMAQLIRSLARGGRLGRRILIYGANDQARKLIERIDRLEEPWNHIVGVFDDRLARVGPNLGRHRVMGNLNDLVAWGRANELDEVLVALPWSAEERLRKVMESLSVLPVNVRLCPEIFLEEMLQARTNHQFGLPMWNAFEKPLAGWDAIGKRAFDLFFSFLILIVAAPLFLFIAMLIKLDSSGPLLFRQSRYGFNNEVIGVYKFRSMRHELADPVGNRLTERDDPRVTRIGKILRRSSLDELPQIINVLRGEMSVVGPRPHALRTTAGGRLCEDVVDRYSVRHKVKPGITGWAQVNGWRGTMEDEEHLRKRIEHDLYYVNNWSPWLDIKILAMTLWIVVRGRNSY